MRSGIDLIKATKGFAVDNTTRSWWCVLSTSALLLAALAGTIWNIHILGQLVCSILSGLLLLRLFVIYHDQQHSAILANSRVASVLMRVFGVFALSPSSVWRSSHNYHHNHNSKLRSAHIGSFPIMTRQQYDQSNRRDRALYLFSRHPLTILFGYLFIFFYGMCVYPAYNTPKRSIDCLLAAVLHVVIGAALVVYLGWRGWLFTQGIPFFLASAIGAYLFYAQHNFPSVSFKDKDGWTYESAALESSSFMKTSPLMSWFTANIGYHHIHHLNSRIPFYRLPEAFAALPELQNPKTTSLSPIDILCCIRLKVWDTERRRMMPLPTGDDSQLGSSPDPA